MENMAQPLNDMDNWTWLAAPVEADFPFQGQADWFMQGEWNGNSMQKYVNGWYVSQGFWGMRTLYLQTMSSSNSAPSMSSKKLPVQALVEDMKLVVVVQRLTMEEM
eukprot:CAMPEP_0205816020 /NCGR_PEP_ID=MMETSP0205-20121125/22062_2 /ASSEMBLY_ACC=CAM_ASM_000278 /TAXON_ID=36767 /ORGANISM="Euplotes focardii, Strain TN1" /LENGTH=105 /DNA_ID=CAMNT_0053103457 /DNA_START=21 /DNA_END=338 /DNA_ORIENTATION=-